MNRSTISLTYNFHGLLKYEVSHLTVKPATRSAVMIATHDALFTL